MFNLKRLSAVSLFWLGVAGAQPLTTTETDADIADANAYIELLGQAYSKDSIQRLKKRLDAPRPEMDYEDATGHWFFYDTKGLDFTFADEAIFTDNEVSDIGKGELFLENVHFYRQSDKDSYEEQHILPFGIRYDDDYQTVTERMKSAGADYKIANPNGENLWAMQREDGKRYGVAVDFDADGKLVEAEIMLYYGQDYMAWINQQTTVVN